MAAVETIEAPRRESWLSAAWFYVRRYPLGAVGALIAAIFVLMAIFAPLITQFDPTVTNPRISLAFPSSEHPLGADFLGRDMWSRIVYGARISLAVVLGSAQLGSTILVEAALSFLGLGVPEPHPSWGRMLSESAAEYVRVAPWLVIFPGAAISLAVFGTNLLGDALRDILDPRQRD